jgi:hypothetical protein
MNCQEIEELLSALLDDELSSKEQLEVEEHLSTCSNCQLKLESLKTVQKVLCKLEKAEPPRQRSLAFQKKLQKKLTQPSSFRRLTPVLIPLAAVILLLLALPQVTEILLHQTGKVRTKGFGSSLEERAAPLSKTVKPLEKDLEAYPTTTLVPKPTVVTSQKNYTSTTLREALPSAPSPATIEKSKVLSSVEEALEEISQKPAHLIETLHYQLGQDPQSELIKVERACFNTENVWIIVFRNPEEWLVLVYSQRENEIIFKESYPPN